MNIKNAETTEIQTLVCPRCGGSNLHHTNVRILNRDEDSLYTDYTFVGSDEFMNKLMESKHLFNPSDRRSGVTIQLWCEDCCPDSTSGRMWFTIAQHKGQTITRFYYFPADQLANQEEDNG